MKILITIVVYWMLADVWKQLVMCQTSDDLARLQWDLFHNYNTSIRPVSNLSDVTLVTIDMYFLQVEHLDMKTQTLKSNGWFQVIWQDQFLIWKPDNYGGIDNIVMVQNKIWIPDIMPVNIVNGKRKFASIDFLVEIHSDGRIVWDPDFNLETTCPVDTRYFPFDTQSCEIQICSWEHPIYTLSLRSNQKVADFSWRLANSEFQIEGTFIKSLQNWTVDNLVFGLKLKRRSRYYLLGLILPVCLMSVMCIISFLVPVQSGEKMAMSMTTLLSFTVYLGVISTVMPKTSENMSFLLMYISALLTTSLLSVLGNAVVLYIHYRGGKDNSDVVDAGSYGKKNTSSDASKESKYSQGSENERSDDNKPPLSYDTLSRCPGSFAFLKVKVVRFMPKWFLSWFSRHFSTKTGPKFAHSANTVFFCIIFFICVSLVSLFSLMVNIQIK